MIQKARWLCVWQVTYKKRQRQQDDFSGKGKRSLPTYTYRSVFWAGLCMFHPYTNLGQSQQKAYWHCGILVWLEKGRGAYTCASGASKFSSLARQQGDKRELCNIYHVHLCSQLGEDRSHLAQTPCAPAASKCYSEPVSSDSKSSWGSRQYQH